MFPAFIHLSTATCLNASLKIGFFFHFSYCYLRRRRMIISAKLQQSWQWRQFVAGHYRCHHERLFLIVDIIRFFLLLGHFPILTPKIGVVYEGRSSRELDKQPKSLLLVIFPIWASWSRVIHGRRFDRYIGVRILTSKIRKQSNRDRLDGARKELGRESQGNRSETPW